MTRRVGVAGIDRRRERFHRSGRALLEQPVGLLQRDVLGLNRLRRLAQLLCALLGMPEVRLLGLPHQEQRHCEDRERPEMRRLVAEEDDAGDEAVDEVMRDEPGEPLLEGAQPALMTLDRCGQTDKPHVDGEVREACCDAGDDRQDTARIALHLEQVQREGADGRQRREREGADVEEHVVQRLPPGAPLDRRSRKRERERGPGAEQGGTGERAHCADGDRAENEFVRQGLARSEERDDRNQTADVVAGAEDEAGDAGCATDQADEADDGSEALREREKGWTVHGMRARMAPLVRRLSVDRTGQRDDMVAVLRDRDKGR